MGVVNTTYTFSGTDTITSSKLNNIIDDTTFTGNAIQGTTLQVVSPGKLAVNAGGITSNELASGAVTTNALADGAVNQAKASNMLLPSGAIMAFAMNGAPTGWLAANGSAVSRTTYSDLWTALGTTSSPYGQGDGSTTFNLPDLRGYFVRGSGTNSDGSVSGTFGVKQADTLQGHNHTSTMGTSYDNVNNISTLPARANRFGGSGDLNAGIASDGTNGTPRTSSETRPKNIAMLYCIKI